MADILCLAGLALSVVAVLLTAVFSIIGKKAGVPLVLFALGVAIILGTGLIPPSKTSPAPTQKTASVSVQRSPDSSSGGIDVDRGLLSVDITIPASLLQNEDMEAFDAEAYAKEEGFSKAVVNADGSVTVTMPKSRHTEIMTELADQYNQMFSEMVGAEDTPYIKSIESAKDFSKIVVGVDKEVYEDTVWDFTPFLLGFSGMMYQTFDGSQLHVEVVIKDADTDEFITSIIYPDVWDADDSEPEPVEEEPAVAPAQDSVTSSSEAPAARRAPSSPAPVSSKAPTSSTAPVPQNQPEPEPVSANGPTLAGDPLIAPMSNPTLSGDPAPDTVSGPALSGGGNSSGSYNHDFSNGRLLGSRESDKYHSKNCMAAQNILFENEIWFGSAADAAAQGYSPCGICYR